MRNIWLTCLFSLPLTLMLVRGQASAQQRPVGQQQSRSTYEPEASENQIPSGTLLPVRLNTSLSRGHSMPGQVTTASIMQDVPLATETTIRKGAKLRGLIAHIRVPARTSIPLKGHRGVLGHLLNF